MPGSRTITSNVSKYFPFDDCDLCRYEGGEREHCLELWNRDGKVLTILAFES